MLQVTGHAGDVPKATLERGRSVEFPSEGNPYALIHYSQHYSADMAHWKGEWKSSEFDKSGPWSTSGFHQLSVNSYYNKYTNNINNN